jgi:ATP-binding protein involved in chromosome partitioning
MPKPIDVAQVEAAVADFQDPETGRSVTKMGQLRDIDIRDNHLRVTLALTTYSAPLWDETRRQLRDQLQAAFPHLDAVQVDSAVHERPPEKLGEIGLAVKSVIAVGSGKGGVGKSTIATAIAYGLQHSGCKVGLMDADVYGPSIPHLVGVSGRPEVDEGTRKIIPKYKDGMPVMSMGLLMQPSEAVVWRGPMLHGAIAQFLRDTQWGQLDYLIIDMPPGTGDIALSLSQLLPLTGAVVVCTPQDVALLDAGKAIAMFQKVSIPVLGMVENMSGFVCPDCGKKHDIFGTGGARRRAHELDIPFLGEVPININIRIWGDESRSGAMRDDPEIGPCLEGISYQLAKNISQSRRSEPPLPTLTVL